MTYIIMFSAGHFFVDFYAGILGPLQDKFRELYGLEALHLLLFISPVFVVGSLLQPILGRLADRIPRGPLAAASLLIATVFMSLCGLAPHPAILSLLLFLGSIGVGLFHPAAASLVGEVLPERASRSMSFLVVGGMVGLSLPGIVVPRVVEYGGGVDLHRTVFVMPVGIVLALLLLVMTRAAPARAAAPGTDLPGDRRGLLAGVQDMFVGTFEDFLKNRDFAPVRLIWYIALIRIFVITSFQRLIPFLCPERGWSFEDYGEALAVTIFCLGCGSLLGGTLFERTRPKKLFVLSTVLPAPFFILFALWSAKTAMWCSGLAAFFLGMATPLTIAWAQKLQPAKAGIISGLLMGFAWGLSELAVPAVELVARYTGRPAALVGVALLLLPAAYLIRWLPEERDASSAGTA